MNTDNIKSSSYQIDNTIPSNVSSVNLKEILFLIKKYIGLILLITASTAIVAIIFSYSRLPIYTSSATISIEENNQAQTVFDFGAVRNRNLLNNETQILLSRSVSENTVRYLLENKYYDNMYLFNTRKYQPIGLRKIITAIKTNIIFSKSSYIPSEVSTNSNISSKEFKAAVSKLMKSFKVENIRKSNILRITVKSNDNVEAAILCNAIAETYQKSDIEWSAGEIINLKTFLDNQLQVVENDLKRVENELKSYSEKEKIYGLDGNSEQKLTQLANVEAQYHGVKAEVKILQERNRFIATKLSKEEKTLTGQLLNSIDNRLLSLRTQIAQNEADLIKNVTIYGENHEAVTAIKRKINHLKTDLATQTQELIAQGISVADPIKYRQSLIDTALAVEASLAISQSRAIEYKKIVDQYSKDLDSLPAKALQYARLERDKNILNETYSFMRQKHQEARISEASEIGKVRIIDPAIAPHGKSSPNTRLDLVIGIIIGLIFSYIVVYFLETIDRTIKSSKDIENLGFKVLGIIPNFGRKNERSISKSLNNTEMYRSKRRVIVATDPKSPISEAFRSLRTNLVYSDNNLNKKSIVVSSPSPGEGKTTVISNLAAAFATMGRNTLLIDADLRRPRLHQTFRLSNEIGLADYLIGTAVDHNRIINPTATSNLSLITAGKIPGNPSELLGTERMINFIANLEERWDIILIDSPPIVAVTDAMILSKAIDGLVLVVKAGHTEVDALSHTVSVIDQIGANLSGIVINGLAREHSYQSYYYYQHYYYDDDKKKKKWWKRKG